MLNVRTSKTTRDPKNLVRVHTFNTADPEISELELELLQEQEKTRKIEENLKKSQDSMVKKEIANKKCLQEFEEKILGRGPGLLPSNSIKNIEKIQEYHSEIQSKLGLVQYKTLQILIEQEKELIQEYRDEFIEDDEKKNQLRKDLLAKPKTQNKELALIKEIEKENKKFQMLEKEIALETEKNITLKLDHAERTKEIRGMKLMVDELKLEREKLRKIFQNSRFSQKLPNLNSFSERKIVPQKDSKFLIIEKLKQDIETCRKQNKDERLKLFKLQESATEAKFLLKRTIQDLNELIEKTTKRNVELIEKSKIIAKIYDATFPVKGSLSARVFSMPKPQVSDFESTMQQIQSLYENYEKSLRTKLAR
jgi:hypothetical protein